MQYNNTPSEDVEQAQLFAWAAQFKQQGIKAGVPDIFLPCARGGYHGLYIELKRTKGGKISAAQKEWIDALRGQGYKVIVCYGFDEAREVIISYLEGAK